MNEIAFYTVDEVSEILRLNKKNAYKLVQHNDFPKLILGRKILIPKEEFEKFIKHNLYSKYEY